MSAARPRKSLTARRMARRGLFFVAPAVLLMLAIYIIPMVVLAVFSVTDYQLGALSTSFIGLDNFRKAFSDPVFLRALWNTVLYAVIVI
ncbi:MAG: sugar ABC transporter permease, partial [Rhizobiaceae bacterium]